MKGKYFGSGNLVNKYAACGEKNNCFVRKRISETSTGCSLPVIFSAWYISSGIKAVPRYRVSRSRRCARPWTDNGLRIADLWRNFSSGAATPPFPPLPAELVAKKYYYRRTACEYAGTCFHFRSRALSQQCVRYTADIYYISGGILQRRGPLFRREGARLNSAVPNKWPS